jgi:hypothetical protein
MAIELQNLIYCQALINNRMNKTSNIITPHDYEQNEVF